MTEQVITLVKIPIGEIEQWIREKHELPSTLTDFRIEEKDLVLYFSEERVEEKEHDSDFPRVPRRRARRKRNRMKTRGWAVVARITNSKGQGCTIYSPFVEALKDPNLAADEQRKLVEGILKSNRNRPSEDSINYFLENTLEYLRQQKQKGGG